MGAPAEREAAGRELAESLLERICPHVAGNPFIPHAPLRQQARFLRLHRTHRHGRVFQALYGGAAGGGKSDALLMAAAQYAWKHSEFAGILFRRTFTDLAQPGALMDRAMQWWVPRGVAWDGTNKIFRFPSGAKVAMAYLAEANDHLRYQGAEYQYTGWDELTQWPTESQYEYVGLSRVRRPANSTIPLRTLAASNPGGPGHSWVMRMFVAGPNGEKAPHHYVPARIADNPHLDRDAYIEGLSMLHPTVREQLLNGDWRARTPGNYFRAEWFGPLLDPATDAWPHTECLRIRWWDLAASDDPKVVQAMGGAAAASKKAKTARTAGVLMARHRCGVRAIEHARAFYATPGKRDDLIVQQAQMDGRGVIVGVEIEGGSGGPAQFEALQKRLRGEGYRVVGARPKAELTDAEGKVLMRNPTGERGKTARADPVASCLERGYQRRGECANTGGPWWGVDAGRAPHEAGDGLRLFAGPWTQDYLDEVEGFPDGDRCDLVDATSGAWAWLEAHPFGQRVPLDDRKLEPPAGDQMDLHPADRAKDFVGDWARDGKDRAGRWRP